MVVRKQLTKILVVPVDRADEAERNEALKEYQQRYQIRFW